MRVTISPSLLHLLPSGYVKIAIENGHRNSGFTHWKWWFSIVMLVYQRVYIYDKYHGSPYVWVGLIMSNYVKIIQHSRSSQRSGKWSKGNPGSIWWVLVTFPSNKLWNLGLSDLISPFDGFWFVIIHRSKIKKHIMFSRFQPNLLPGVIFNPKNWDLSL
jgi:hypothetical protein